MQAKPGPKGPGQDVVAAVVDMKQRNPTWGCPRIAQQIALAFGISLSKDVVRRILAVRHQPRPESAGPSWLTVLGSTVDRPGEVWIDELRLDGVRKDVGKTGNFAIQANFADVLAVNGSYSKQDQDFFRVGSGVNQGTGLNHTAVVVIESKAKALHTTWETPAPMTATTRRRCRGGSVGTRTARMLRRKKRRRSHR